MAQLKRRSLAGERFCRTRTNQPVHPPSLRRTVIELAVDLDNTFDDQTRSDRAHVIFEQSVNTPSNGARRCHRGEMSGRRDGRQLWLSVSCTVRGIRRARARERETVMLGLVLLCVIADDRSRLQFHDRCSLKRPYNRHSDAAADRCYCETAAHILFMYLYI